MNGNFEYYRVFDQVARLGSISLAAEALYLSQPAVSQTIRQLEQNLGCLLFVRTPRGVRLTPEGQALYQHAAGCEQILLGEKKLAKMLSGEAGEIRIGASEITLQFYLLPHLERYHSRFPKIEMNLTNSSTPETIAALLAGKIDFGVVSSPIPEGAGLTVYPVGEIQDLILAGERFAELRGRTIPLEELVRYPMICLSPGTSTRRYLDEFFLSHGVLLSPKFHLATTDLIVPFVRRNFGIGIVIDNFAKEALRSGEVFAVKTPFPHPSPKNLCGMQKGAAALPCRRGFSSFAANPPCINLVKKLQEFRLLLEKE